MSAPPFSFIFENSKRCHVCQELFVRSGTQEFPTCSEKHDLCDKHISSCGKCIYSQLFVIFSGNYIDKPYEWIRKEISDLCEKLPNRDISIENGEYSWNEFIECKICGDKRRCYPMSHVCTVHTVSE